MQLALGPTIRVELNKSWCKSHPMGGPAHARLGASRHKQSMHGRRSAAHTATGLPARNNLVQDVRNLEIPFPAQGLGRIRPEAITMILQLQVRSPSFVIDYLAITASPTSRPRSPWRERSDMLMAGGRDPR